MNGVMVGTVGALAIGLLGVGLLLGWHLGSSTRSRLAESETRLRSLYASVHAGVLIRSSDGSVVYINDVGAKILGMSPSDVRRGYSPDVKWERIDAEGRPVPEEEPPSMVTLRTGEPIQGAVRGVSFCDSKLTRWLLINTSPQFEEGTRTVRDVVVTFLDITATVAATNALQTSRDRLALYLDIAGVILLALDTEGRIQLINRRGCELLGASREELVGTDWFAECLPPEEQPRIRSLFSRVMAGEDGVAERAENVVRTRSGDLRVIAWRNAVTRDAQGRATGVVASGEDVTALRASERALREALAWQEAIVEADPDGIFVSDEASRLIAVNGAASRLTSYSRTELLEMSVADLDVDATRADIEAVRRRIEEGEPAIREVALRRRDGTSVEVELNSTRVVIDGKAYVHTAARDLTERRILTRALRQSEHRYRVLFEGMLEGFALHEMIWDESGEPADSRFLDVNPAFERLTGLRRRDIVGQRVSEILPAVESFWIQRFGDVVRTGTPARFESHSADLQRHYLVSAFRPGENQFAVTLGDVTSRVKVERALQDSVDQLALAQEVAGIGYMDVDLSTGKGFWSPRTFALLGLDPERAEASLDGFASALLPENREAFLASVDAARVGQVPPPFVYTVVAPSGSTVRIRGQSSVTQPSEDGARHMLTVLHDVTSEEAASAEREELLRRLRALAARLVAVREEERAALSRELHDGVGQALTGMRMDLSMLRSSLPAKRTDMREALSTLIGSSDQCVDVVRNISSRLRPPILDIMGLGPALEWQVEEYNKKAPTSFHVDVTRCPTNLPKLPSVALFRIAQEALTNVLRHSGATDVWVTVESRDGAVILEVRDNGRGVKPGELTSPTALGLVGMHERALSLRGSVLIDTSPGGGTRVRVSVPLAQVGAQERA